MRASTLKSSDSHLIDEKKRVLTKAFIKLAERLNLSRQELSVIIGTSEASLSRVFANHALLNPDSNEGRLALLLLRLYRSLDTLFGGNAEQCKLWLRSENQHLHGQPILVIQTIEGLVLVVHYLDAMRGKN